MEKSEQAGRSTYRSITVRSEWDNKGKVVSTNDLPTQEVDLVLPCISSWKAKAKVKSKQEVVRTEDHDVLKSVISVRLCNRRRGHEWKTFPMALSEAFRKYSTSSSNFETYMYLHT